MAYHAAGYRQIGPMGQPAADSPAGSVRQLHSFVTNDDRAAVETSNYFDPLLTPSKKIQKGDLLVVSYDTDGTPGTRTYVLDIVSNHVVLRAEADDAGTPTRAVVPTADGLTTGLIFDTDEFVVATSGGANNWLTLPLATEATRGREIQIWVVPSTNCELRTPATANQTINNVACGSSNNEALLTHTQLYVLRQHLADGWLLQAFTALGAVATAIVPDA